MDILVYYWSEEDSGVKIKYLTSITFGCAKVQDVVTEIVKALEKLSSPVILMPLFGFDEPNVNKSLINKLTR